MTPGLALLLMAQHPVAVASFFPAFLSFSNHTYDISFRASKNVEGASKTLIYWPRGPVGIFFMLSPATTPTIVVNSLNRVSVKITSYTRVEMFLYIDVSSKNMLFVL